ncbi:metallophosphoesterase family protein [Dictyobacter kobayashii]|uniref:metallophosphoesterase family protein n=1 Tax=Dictyobacter kobayashii TaxID=2014872 RepID=UPI000F8244FE|nr:metallophosphoesterase family protein [Dictyobacter kobayashii]
MPEIENTEQSNTNTYNSYAIGDIHGEVTLLKRLLASLPLRPEDHLIFLGDYVDRGEDSIEVIRTLKELPEQYEHCFFLRGNHEDAWLEVWDGTAFQEQPLMPGARKVWESCDGQIPAEIGEWMNQTRIDYEDANAYYVHAGVLPGKPFWSTAHFLRCGGRKVLWSAIMTGVRRWSLAIMNWTSHWLVSIRLVSIPGHGAPVH